MPGGVHVGIHFRLSIPDFPLRMHGCATSQLPGDGRRRSIRSVGSGALYRERTTILPHRAATRLVTRGPFRIPGNPIYVGNMVAIVGLALAVGNACLIVFGLFAAIWLDRLVIRREEIYLSTRFGGA
jgi:hypothetical protein